MNLYKNRVVIKVGTSTLTNDLGQNNIKIFDKLACEIGRAHVRTPVTS